MSLLHGTYGVGTSGMVCSDAPQTNIPTCSSDKRLKNIHGFYNKGLNEILKLNPVRFNFKKNKHYPNLETKHEKISLIAQDVKPIFPEAVGKR